MENLGFTGKLVCSLPVSNHKASSEWYVKNLGFSVLFDNDEMGMSYLATTVENVWLDLSQVENPSPQGTALVWGVESADNARKQLEDRGVRFDGPTREFGGMVKLATFFDPDGNTLMFYENLGSDDDN